MMCVIKGQHCKVKRVTTNNDATVNVLKFQILLSFCSQLKLLVIRARLTKYLSQYQTWKTLIRLLLKKQSDLVCTVCLGLFVVQLVVKSLKHLPHYNVENSKLNIIRFFFLIYFTIIQDFSLLKQSQRFV